MKEMNVQMQWSNHYCGSTVNVRWHVMSNMQPRSNDGDEHVNVVVESLLCLSSQRAAVRDVCSEVFFKIK